MANVHTTRPTKGEFDTLTNTVAGKADSSTVTTDLAAKADKVSGGTSGHLAGIDSSGNLTDSGKAAADFIPASDKGANGGVPILDSNAQVPLYQLPTAVINGDAYQGVWNASTNSPTIPAASSTNIGWWYRVGTAGTTTIDGTSSWAIGDLLVSDGAQWDKIDNTAQVTSVAGKTGSVTLGTADITGLDTDLSAKADKVSGGTSGDLAGLDSSGNTTDSGINVAAGTGVASINATVLSTDPSTPSNGDLWLKSDNTLNMRVGTTTNTYAPVPASGNATSTQVVLGSDTRLMPSGVMLDFAGSGSAPTGYLLADGSPVSRTTYADLYTAIGTTWGAGDGLTTFNLPDTRRRVSVGSGGTGTTTLGNAVGDVGGEETHTLSKAEMPSHSHAYSVNPNNSGGTPYGPSVASGPTGSASTYDQGGDTAHNNMQPSIVVQKIIKT